MHKIKGSELKEKRRRKAKETRKDASDGTCLPDSTGWMMTRRVSVLPSKME
jgi:hypothetical protein